VGYHNKFLFFLLIKYLFLFSIAKGVMTQEEKKNYESVIPAVNLFWIPATWFVSALNEAVSAGTLKNESGTKLIMEVSHFYYNNSRLILEVYNHNRTFICLIKEFLDFRANCGILWSYNWVSIPMIYTQVSNTNYFQHCFLLFA
jgi:Bestrophin, RFP-TM, chloride channel